MTRSEAIDKICLALDVPDAPRAQELVRTLQGHVGLFKIGLELFAAEGHAFVRTLVDQGTPVFLDLKFHDIPNTVAHVSKVVTGWGVRMFNLHASGGLEMMRSASEAAAETADQKHIARPAVIAVTVLTSFDEAMYRQTTGTQQPVHWHVGHLAQLTQRAGLAGVVASPHELQTVQQACGQDFLTVIPGIRTVQDQHGDQRRVMGPKEAVAMGAHVIVVGRPIREAPDPVQAVEAIIASLTS
jgi:orotidine-5'-phosphate decarboxylase